MTRWALLGFGAGGRVFHAPMVAAAEGLELIAATTSDPTRIRQAEAMGLTACRDLSELVELGVEGVTITTPAGTHVELAHHALDASLHVVVDKPFAITGDEAVGVVEHAAKSNRTLTVYQNRRWDGDFLTLAALIDSGRLGSIHRFTNSIERFHPDLPRWTTHNDPLEGGGTLVDLGPHLIDQALTLFGPVDSVFADFGKFGHDHAAENDIVLLLSHASGVTSTIVASLAAAVEGPRFKVNGEHGGVLIRGFDIQEEQLFAGLDPQNSPSQWGREPADRVATVVADGETTQIALRRGRWDTFYPAVASAIAGDTDVPVDPEGAIHLCRIFDAARASASSSERVAVAGL